jgi:TRAP-type C4-dicarboxylate transport system permease small subunit
MGLESLLAGLIMTLGSLGLWAGTPLLWLWVGSQVQGATDSLSVALVVMFLGVVAWVAWLAWVMAWLSGAHRAVAIANGETDPGHVMLERVLIISAAIVLVGFGIWFFLLAGASPIPVGFNL